MKTADHFTCAILLSVFLFAACQAARPPVVGDAQCADIAQKGYVSILDLNVCYTEVVNLEKNFRHIADFVAQNDVDIILLQEVVGSEITGMDNSAIELRKILLKEHNMRFSATTAWDLGISNFFIDGNAILSRCEIAKTDIKKISTPGNIGKKQVALSRNVHLAVVSIPGYGNLNVYNTHLCARCKKSERESQLERALSWIEKTNAGSRLAIFGGDMNFDRIINSGTEAFMWEKIIAAGFIDAYANRMIRNSSETLETLCEDEDNADEHCTKGVTQLDDYNSRRIDYIFTNSPATVRAARVVFNEMVNSDEPTLSDHAGVFIRLDLP
jgi:maltose 6'-phosphate phosphatase